MDVTNPGLTNVANQVYGNPSPNGGSALLIPEELDTLAKAAAQAYPPPGNGVSATTFPTPAQVIVTGNPGVPVTLSSKVPFATEVIVNEQSSQIGIQPDEFLVVGPNQSVQTNNSKDTTTLCTITGVYDADSLYNAANGGTIRYLLTVAPPSLTSYPISVLGRQITFADDTTTAADQGANRIITGFGGNYVVIDQSDSDLTDDGGVPTLTPPVIGDTFWLNVQREGSQQVNFDTGITVDVTIQPAPPVNVPLPDQALLVQDGFNGGVNNSTGAQPNTPIITSGVQVPTAINVEVSKQATTAGLPTNVYI